MRDAVDARLREWVDGCREDALREAMAYSLFAGGKRLRPRLLLAACEAVKGSFDDCALNFACALEMIHTYSLIHDDLPAMDDDDYRRGRLTCHKMYGEATAILAGDALLSLAFEVMAENALASGTKRPVAAMCAVARAAGASGMVAGQVSDMLWEHKKCDADALLYIHERKTGALITSCLEAGSLLGGATAAQTQKMTRLGALIGMAFQIKDDILDVTADATTLGKPAHSDEKNEKNTYVSVHGLDKARADYTRLSEQAFTLLDKIPQKTPVLRNLVRETVDRTY